MIRYFWFALLCLLHLAVAAQPANPGKMWAVVIGVGEYVDDKNFPPLPFALEDAKGIYTFFVSPEGRDLREQQVKYLPNASEEDIDSAMVWLNKVVRNEDKVLVYYSGHGAQEEDGDVQLTCTYLVPSDAKAGKLAKRAFRLENFKKVLWELKALQVALILDCCYSGTVLCDENKQGLRAGVVKKKQIPQALKSSPLPDDRILITSCAADEEAMELTGYQKGAFTFYLLQGLQGPADANNDRKIDLEEAFLYLKKKVEEIAAFNSHKQTPAMECGKLSEPYYLKISERPLELVFDKPAELKNGDYVETVTKELEIDGWTRYGAGVKEIKIGHSDITASLMEMGNKGTYFQLTVPLKLGENVIEIVATDNLGQQKKAVVTANRKEDPVVKLEITPSQVICSPGEQICFRVTGITKGGQKLERIPRKWHAQYGKINSKGLYTAPMDKKTDEVHVTDLPLQVLSQTVKVSIQFGAVQAKKADNSDNDAVLALEERVMRNLRTLDLYLKIEVGQYARDISALDALYQEVARYPEATRKENIEYQIGKLKQYLQQLQKEYVRLKSLPLSVPHCESLELFYGLCSKFGEAIQQVKEVVVPWHREVQSRMKKDLTFSFGLPDQVWQASSYLHQGNRILDMTTDYWLELAPAEQQRYAKSYQEGYASSIEEPCLRYFPAGSARIDLVLLPPARFFMGSLFAESGLIHEKRHRVVLAAPFYISKYEITQEQWLAVMHENPSYFQEPGLSLPVDYVSWEDSQIFCQKTGLRLPSEAEWEYACRGGTTGRFCYGEDLTTLADYTWFDSNAGRKTHEVGRKRPNAFGLYDMHGNVWEWCQDWYGPYPGDDVSNPTGRLQGVERVYRGGGWSNSAEFCRSAYRHHYTPEHRHGYLGLRCAYSVGQK